MSFNAKVIQQQFFSPDLGNNKNECNDLPTLGTEPDFIGPPPVSLKFFAARNRIFEGWGIYTLTKEKNNLFVSRHHIS